VPRASAGKAREPQSHGRWVEGKQESESSRQLAEEVRKKAKEARDEAEASKLLLPTPPSPAPAVVAPVTGEGDQSEGKGDFFPAAVFVGRKVGYVFKRGDKGLGYYLDPFRHETPAPSSLPLAAAPISSPARVPVAPLPSSLAVAAGAGAGEHQSFLFEFRQTKEAVAVIVQVPGIIESSVDLHFGPRSFDLYFKAVAAGDSSGEGRRLVEHSQGFDLFGEVQVERCRYDVATQNLVVLLHKLQPEYWLDRTTAAATGALAGSGSLRREILSARPYRSVRGGGAGEMKGSPAGETNSSAPSSSIPIPSPSELLEAMKFSTQGLLDLD
jgi:hypothetical protein